MRRIVHLGFTCLACRARVPAYSFASSNGGAPACTPPVDQVVQCPNCDARREVPFSDIVHLDRWEAVEGEPAA